MKKARREGEDAGRQEAEAEISRLKQEADGKVEELTTFLETMKDRVKSHDAKMDAQVRGL